jgi:hypothetical protein
MGGNAFFPKGNNSRAAEFRRLATDDLMRAIVLDVEPRETTLKAFGIRTQEHLEAIYEPVRHGEITRKQLHEAVGDGSKITAMVNAANTNPHPGIEFMTGWDGMDSTKAASAEAPAKEKEKDIDLER